MQFMVDITHDPLEQLTMVHHLLGEAITARKLAMPPPPPPPAVTDTTTAAAPPPPADDTPSPAAVFGKQEVLPDAFKPGVERVPAIVPTSSAPPAIPPDTSPPAAVEELDSAGQKYDPNIHSASKAKMKNGQWKKRRGGPITPPPPPMVPATPPASTAPAASAPATPPPPAAVPPPPAATAPIAPAVPPPPPADAAVIPTGPTFRSVVAKCTAATASGKLTHERVRELCVQAGAPDLMTLNAMPGLIPTVDALIDAALLGA